MFRHISHFRVYQNAQNLLSLYQQQTQPTDTMLGLGIEPEWLCWEESALTTVH